MHSLTMKLEKIIACYQIYLSIQPKTTCNKVYPQCVVKQVKGQRGSFTVIVTRGNTYLCSGKKNAIQHKPCYQHDVNKHSLFGNRKQTRTT